MCPYKIHPALAQVEMEHDLRAIGIICIQRPIYQQRSYKRDSCQYSRAFLAPCRLESLLLGCMMYFLSTSCSIQNLQSLSTTEEGHGLPRYSIGTHSQRQDQPRGSGGRLTCGFKSRCAKDSACMISSPESICSVISCASISGSLPECAFTFVSRSPRGINSMARKTSDWSLNHPRKSTKTAASRDFAKLVEAQ